MANEFKIRTAIKAYLDAGGDDEFYIISKKDAAGLPDTLEAAREKLREAWRSNEQAECDCCHQSVKKYPRTIHSTMAFMLTRLYRYDQENPGGYAHVGTLMVKGQTATSDFSKLKFWGLVVEHGKDEEDSTRRTSGEWAITDKGRKFVRGEITVPKIIYMFNKKAHGTDGGEVGIRDCLGNKFNYEELMA